MAEDPKNPQKTGLSLSDMINQVNAGFSMAGANTFDPYRQAKAEGFNAAPSEFGGLNHQRYYGRNAYKELGFNPYIDNEKYYNQNTTVIEDMNEARRQWTSLFNLGFSSLWNGKTSQQEAYEYARYSNIGSSTRGGFMGSFTNAGLNSGYTIGLLSEIALEEIAMLGLEAVTLGGATPVVVARTGANAARLGRGAYSAAKMGQKLSIVNRLKSLKNLTKAKNFYQAAGKFGQAVNPLRGTTEFLTDVGRMGIKDPVTGKITKLGTMAKMQKGFGAFYRDLREINLAVDEAQLEMGFVKNRTENELVNKFVEDKGRHPNAKEMEDIRKQADIAGQNTMFQNTWLIYATNRVAFGNYFNKWMPRALRSTSKKVAGGRFVKNLKTGKLDFIKHGGVLGYKTFVNEAKHAFKKSTLKRMPLQTAKFLGKYTRVNFGEGLQEYFQEVIQDAEVSMAKDRYYGAMAGGIWYDTMLSDDYMNAYQESMKKYLSHEGAEVFASGFMMGMFAGPFSKGSQYLTNKLGDGAKYLFNNKQYKADQAAKDKTLAEIEEKVERFNKMTETNQDFLKDFISYALRQKARQDGIKEAEDFDDQKSFMDLKDESLVDQILFAESMDAFDLVIEKLKSMSELSEEELKEAFTDLSDEEQNLPTDFKESAESVVEKAQRIHEMSQNFDKLFPPPPEYGLIDSDVQTGIQQKDVKRAWQRAKYQAILNQYSLVRTMDRMESIMKSLYGKKAPFWKTDNTPPANDITRIFDRQEMSDELILLKQEIKAMEGSQIDPKSKRDFKYKKQLVKELESLGESIDLYKMATIEKAAREQMTTAQREAGQLGMGRTLNYKRGSKEWEGKIVGETTNKKGQEQWIVEKADESTSKILKSSSGIVQQEVDDVNVDEIMMEPLRELRASFKSYMELIAEQNKNAVDEAKLEEAFNDYTDFFDLEADYGNLSKTVSLLLNPKAHAEFVDRYNQMFQRERENQEETMRAQMQAFVDSKEVNDLVEYITKNFNAFILEEDLIALKEDAVMPDEFYDVESLSAIKTSSDRHQSIENYINDWLVETNRVEVEEEVTEEEAAPETATAQPQTEGPKERVTFDTPFEEWPEELKTVANEAFNQHNQAMQEAVAEGNERMANLIFNSVEDYVTSQAGRLKLRQTLQDWNGDAEIVEEVKQKVQPKPQPKKPTQEFQEYEEPVIRDEDVTIIEEKPEPKDMVRVDYELDPYILQQVLRGEKQFMSLPIPANFTAPMVQALQAAGHLQGNKLDITQLIDVQMVINVGETDVILGYRGKNSISEAATLKGVENTADFIEKLNLPETPQGKYTIPYEMTDKTVYVESEDQLLWLKGQGKQHVFEITVRPTEQEVIRQTATIDAWIKEVRNTFRNVKTIDEADAALESITQKNLQREINNEAFLTDEEIQAQYDRAVSEMNANMKPADFNVGEQYELKGKLSNFGPSVVREVTKDGVVFESFETKERSEPQGKDDLPKVIKGRITDMEEKIAQKSVEVSPEQERANKESKKINQELTSEEIEKKFEENKNKSADEVANSFFTKAKEDEENCG